MNKQQTLQHIIGKIQHKFGSRAIQQAKSLRTLPATLSTGFTALDDLCQLSRGTVTTFTGKPTSGLTTLTFFLMAAAQKSGKHLVYVDTGHTFNGAYATTCGVNIEQMLLVEAHHPSLVLDVLREVANSHVIDLLVINLMALRKNTLDIRPIQTIIHQSQCAIVLLARPKFQVASALRLAVMRLSWLRDGRDVVGCLSSVRVTRNRFGKTGTEIMLLIPFGKEAVR